MKTDSSCSPALAGIRVLAVEDQPDLRDMLVILLEQQGAQVIACESARQAFAVLLSGQPFDAAVFDVSMPEEDGLTLVGRLRRWEAGSPRSPRWRLGASGHLPVIALTAHVSPEMRRRCEAAGFDCFLAKPVVSGSLFSAIRRLAQEHGQAH